MSTDALKELWREGRTALGAWLSLREPIAAEVASNAGYDYVCIDMQHGLASYTDAVTLLHAIASGPATPIVRVPWNEPGIIGRVLDAGALGVVIPMVNTPEDAARAVAACRYAPTGARSIGPMTVANRYGMGYFGLANEHVACIPMIETRQAVECIDEILAVPGIDAIYVGPADLSISYGLRPGVDNPGHPFDTALASILEACRSFGVVPGIHANAALAEKRHASGFRMITVGFDATPMLTGIRADVATARAATQSGGQG